MATVAAEPDQSQSQKDERRARGMRGLEVGYTLMGAVLVGFGGGWLIDGWAGTRPLWTVILACAFIVAGLYQVVKEYSK